MQSLLLYDFTFLIIVWLKQFTIHFYNTIKMTLQNNYHIVRDNKWWNVDKYNTHSSRYWTHFIKSREQNHLISLSNFCWMYILTVCMWLTLCSCSTLTAIYPLPTLSAIHYQPLLTTASFTSTPLHFYNQSICTPQTRSADQIYVRWFLPIAILFAYNEFDVGLHSRHIERVVVGGRRARQSTTAALMARGLFPVSRLHSGAGHRGGDLAQHRNAPPVPKCVTSPTRPPSHRFVTQYYAIACLRVFINMWMIAHRVDNLWPICKQADSAPYFEYTNLFVHCVEECIGLLI